MLLSSSSHLKWQEDDDNIQHVTVIQLQEEIAEFEKCIQTSEEAMTLELENVLLLKTKEVVR